MEKKRTVQRISNKKRGRPKVRFNFMIVVIIFALSFIGCFGLYMIMANIKGDFLDEDNDKVVVEESTAGTSGGEEPTSGSEPQTQAPPKAEIVYPVPQSAAVDISYYENCCLITDSTLSALLAKSDNSSFMEVFGNSQLNATNCNSTAISSPYGSVTAYEIMQIKKPMNLYIMLGSDIGASSVDEMIAGYTTLVSNLHNDRPEMKIYVMQIPPVIADTETVTNALINEYNGKLMEMAKNAGVYCIDTNTALKSAEGALDEKYWSGETGTLTDAAYNAISGYILTHTA